MNFRLPVSGRPFQSPASERLSCDARSSQFNRPLQARRYPRYKLRAAARGHFTALFKVIGGDIAATTRQEDGTAARGADDATAVRRVAAHAGRAPCTIATRDQDSPGRVDSHAVSTCNASATPRHRTASCVPWSLGIRPPPPSCRQVAERSLKDEGAIVESGV